MVHNNTIVDNTNEGITFTGSNTPDVRNNILYFNNADAVTSVQTAGVGTTYYCCIYDPNNAPTSVPDSDGNITCEPDFVYDSEPYGYYHIKYESDCRNGGDNTCVGQDETDMDDEPRIADDAYDIVDVGADEVDCEDTYDPNDWTYDGVINLEEFAIFAVAWAGHDLNDPVCDPNHLDYVSDPNDPDYISAEQKEAWDPYFNFDAAGDS
ncbi:MAG: right-handed parallel beta-helix repeat-containing protein, partial [Anaerohalosphaera sp.]|nr:right-handed parallel beta-helix repeat-containing protein [Anaerohalosphaera sp.]